MALPSGQGSGATQGGAPAGSTGSPSASGATTAPSSLEATPVTSKNLPAATDLVFGDQAYTVAETYRGDGQAPVAACQTMGWQDAGPIAVWTRTYNGKDGRFAGGAPASPPSPAMPTRWRRWSGWPTASRAAAGAWWPRTLTC